MRWHEIPEEVARAALDQPDWEESSLAGRVNRWKQVGERFLRLTVREDPDRVIVISAVFKRRRPERREDA